MKAWQIGVLAGVVLIAVAIGATFMLYGDSTKAAATVNGVAIPESEVEGQLAVIKQQQAALFEGPDGAEQEKRFREQVVTFLINGELIKQEADKLGIKVTDKEIDQRFKQVKDLFPDEKQFQQALQEQQMSETTLREQIGEQVVADKMMERVTKDIKVTKKDQKDHYQENKQQFIEPEQRHWRQILSKSKKDAESVRTELEDGADFAKLAKEKSTDEQTKNDGGDIGWAGVNDFPPEITDALKDVKVDELSKVIDVGEGQFAVFRLEGIREEKQLAYKDVSSQIEEQLKSDAQQAEFSKLIERLNKEAKIKKN